ncbi:hypothetical protein CEXT_136901 [Caerostris extrusa]|uniref:Transmembrane protein n=1 Tax=Caerostris extrusa TaxID=172846 RepID=A0AAV4U7H4_CAEEX|nr:hypothetical protein CEXT_136901 [Caerostris extrusa]
MERGRHRKTFVRSPVEVHINDTAITFVDGGHFVFRRNVPLFSFLLLSPVDRMVVCPFNLGIFSAAFTATEFLKVLTSAAFASIRCGLFACWFPIVTFVKGCDAIKAEFCV